MTDTLSPAPDFLEMSDGRRIAYHKLKGRCDAAQPGIVFLGGFKSDMTGTKAVALERWAAARGRAFLRFDYTGHGASSGDFLDGCIGDWARDAKDAVDALTEGPQILVGSSMGGWISLILARASAQFGGRVAGLATIAAAPDFTADSMEASFTEAQKAEMAETGRIELPSDYSDEPYVITAKLIEDGRNHLVLRDPLSLPFPVRMMQGTADTDVPQERALILLSHIACPDLRLNLVKGADHRFSEPREIAILGETLDELTRACAAAAGAG
ncbi:alpha/beta hydrolase [Rhodovulum sp. DZ06]|uniref:alpha/beta hydrolase n=1 Tax=Rhodovulum sp. DZ06 TaxID=3425126 RepID=UPI003D3274E0